MQTPRVLALLLLGTLLVTPALAAEATTSTDCESRTEPFQPLHECPDEDSPGVGVPLVLAGLAAVALVARRRA